MIRVYFNKRGPLPWSVDLGAQNSEVQVRAIHLENVSGDVKFDPQEKRPEKPCAWMEFPESSLTISRGRALIRGKALQ